MIRMSDREPFEWLKNLMELLRYPRHEQKKLHVLSRSRSIVMFRIPEPYTLKIYYCLVSATIDYYRLLLFFKSVIIDKYFFV